jgi:glycosyltransferase involved in cell wall biosynthesis
MTYGAPNAPVLDKKTTNSITLQKIEGALYSIDGGATWQESNVFTGLKEYKEYSFVAKYAAGTKVSPVMKTTTDAVKYCGTIPFDKSVERIQQYDALLFPTRWDGEGFAGTIVDAFSAGLPVLATDWNCNGEIVENMTNGILYPNSDIQNLEEAIVWLLQHPDKAAKMRQACICSAQQYQPDAYIKEMVAFIET